ncbi:MAG: hypothetical protein ACRD18_10215, partial [Terriglobia bacterium]
MTRAHPPRPAPLTPGERAGVTDFSGSPALSYWEGGTAKRWVRALTAGLRPPPSPRFRQSGCGIEWGNGGGEQELECGDVFWGDILRQGTSKDRDD